MKTAAESHLILVEVYGEDALDERTCQKWFARLKNGDFGLEDEDRPGQREKFEDEELEALRDRDYCQTKEELAKFCGSQSSSHFKSFKSSQIHLKACKLVST